LPTAAPKWNATVVLRPWLIAPLSEWKEASNEL